MKSEREFLSRERKKYGVKSSIQNKNDEFHITIHSVRVRVLDFVVVCIAMQFKHKQRWNKIAICLDLDTRKEKKQQARKTMFDCDVHVLCNIALHHYDVPEIQLF